MKRNGALKLVPRVLEQERKLGIGQPEARGDGAIRESVVAALLAQPELRTCTIRAQRNSRIETVHEGPAGFDACGEIEVTVSDGVIMLEGRVISHAHRRLAGVLAWWSRGRRDVINGLDVEPPEADGDAELTDSLRLVLESDPSIDPAEVRLRCAAGVVTLDGWVRSRDELRRVELDAWYVDSVRSVVNRLALKP
jgi:osmotically-inducible protein OsmY